MEREQLVEADVGPREPSASPVRLVELAVGISSLVLVLGYVSGRFYLEAYYGVFNLSLSDTNSSLQDVTFASLRAMLRPIYLVNSLTGSIFLVSSISRNASKPREWITPWLAVALLPLLVMLAMQIKNFVMYDPLYATSEMMLMIANLGIITIIGATVWQVYRDGFNLRKGAIAYASSFGLLVYLVSGFQGYFTGLSQRQGPIENLSLPHGFIYADAEIDHAWILDPATHLYVSPMLFLLTRDSDFVVAWSPDNRDETLFIPTSSIHHLTLTEGKKARRPAIVSGTSTPTVTTTPAQTPAPLSTSAPPPAVILTASPPPQTSATSEPPPQSRRQAVPN